MGIQLYGQIHFGKSIKDLLGHMVGKTIKEICLTKNYMGEENKKGILILTEEGYAFSVEVEEFWDDGDFVESLLLFHFNLQKDAPEWMHKYDK